jgi:hypothetical protein
MFSYLLPQLKKADTEVIRNKSTRHLITSSGQQADEKNLMKRHFPQAKFNVSVGLPKMRS